MGSIASLLFYIIAFLLSVLFVYWGNRDRAMRTKIVLGKRSLTINPLLIIAALIPVLVAGFRQGVGTDFTSYVMEYNAAIQGGSYLEASFNIIANISNNLFGSPTFMFVAFAALTAVPVMLTINKCSSISKKYYWLFWALFLFIMFPQTFNLLRQGVAVALSFYLLVSIIEKRKLISLSNLVILFLAISFHSSAFIIIPLGVVAYMMNNTQKRSIALFIFTSTVVVSLSFVLLPGLLDLIGGAWSGYLEKETVSRSIIPRSLLIIFILLICWKFSDRLRTSNSYIALLWVGLLVSVGGLFVAYFERIGYYVTLLVPLLVLVMIVQKVSKSQRGIVNFGMIIFAMMYFIIVYYLMGSSDIFPYNFVQQGVA